MDMYPATRRHRQEQQQRSRDKAKHRQVSSLLYSICIPIPLTHCLSFPAHGRENYGGSLRPRSDSWHLRSDSWTSRLWCFSQLGRRSLGGLGGSYAGGGFCLVGGSYAGGGFYGFHVVSRCLGGCSLGDPVGRGELVRGCLIVIGGCLQGRGRH